MRKMFLTLLSAVAAAFSAVTRPAANFIALQKRKRDPFDNLGMWFSHVTRAWHKNTLAICGGFALVAVALVPASAMPVFSASHGAIRWFSMSSAGLATIGATAQKAPQKKPFRFGTVRRRINIGNFAMTPGTQLPSVVIPQVGMLARVFFDVEGTYTGANAPLVVNNFATLNNISDGMDALFSRAQITLNNGSANIVDLSGVGVNIINQNISPSLPIKRGTAGVGNVQGTGFPLAIGAGAFSYKGILPVNANQRRQFEMGLINLQAPEIRATINLSFNSLATIFTVAANCTVPVFTVNLSYEYYEIPNLNEYQLPPLTLVRSIEEAPAAIAATGDQIYQIPRLGTMIEYHAVLVLNQLYSNVGIFGGTMTTAKISELRLRYNKTDVQFDVFIGDLETQEAEVFGSGVGPAVTPSAASDNSQTWLNPSALSLNFWAAGDRPWNGGDFRDAIDTEENTTTEMIVTITTGTALNAGKDNLFHVRRVVQRIVPTPLPMAA